MLISELIGVKERTNPTRDVAKRLAAIFDYVRDAARLGVDDNWPSRGEIEANIVGNGGRLVGDCDDFAFAAAYALHDLDVGARVVTGADETGGGHMVCEDEYGSVIDNRHPGRTLTWNELERIGYRSARMNAIDFEGRPLEWHFVKVDIDGRRDYA